MSDRIFIDTNILVYAHTDINKRNLVVAHELTKSNHSFISTQVLQELANTLSRKFKFKYEYILTQSYRRVEQ